MNKSQMNDPQVTVIQTITFGKHVGDFRENKILYYNKEKIQNRKTQTMIAWRSVRHQTRQVQLSSPGGRTGCRVLPG